MFHRGRNRDAPVTVGVKNDGSAPVSLSHSALRTGLQALGVPLGDEDFINLIARTDSNRDGKVSYPDFCEALKLHRIRDNYDGHCATASTLERPSSAPPQLFSQTIEQGRATIEHFRKMRARGEGGGSDRRRAMELAPAASMDLEGGIFHRKPSTNGCTNPNFTTTMFPPNCYNAGKYGPTLGEFYRPKRRQSPAPAPAAERTGVQAKSHGQTLLVSGYDSRSQLWNETGTEAESSFRHGLGAKKR